MDENFKIYFALPETSGALKRMKNFILISCALFIFGIIIGYLIYQINPGNEIFNMILDELEKIGGKLGEKNSIEMIIFIFLHNLQSLGALLMVWVLLIFLMILISIPILSVLFILCMLLGFLKKKIENYVLSFIYLASVILIGLGAILILTIIFIFILINGAIIGFFFGAAGNPLLFIAVIPHGIFEIPAILIAAAFGMRLGFVILFPGKGKTRSACVREVFRDIIKISILIIILLFIAAVIEVMISARLAEMLV